MSCKHYFYKQNVKERNFFIKIIVMKNPFALEINILLDYRLHSYILVIILLILYYILVIIFTTKKLSIKILFLLINFKGKDWNNVCENDYFAVDNLKENLANEKLKIDFIR